MTSSRFKMPPMAPEEIRSLRGDMSRHQWARLIGVNMTTIKNLEEGRTSAAGAVLTLMTLLRDHRQAMFALLLASRGRAEGTLHPRFEVRIYPGGGSHGPRDGQPARHGAAAPLAGGRG